MPGRRLRFVALPFRVNAKNSSEKRERSDMRLSKLQKWILTQAYKKTVLFDNSGLVMVQAWEGNYMEEALNNKTHQYWQYLFRSEILQGYFGCETDKDKFSFNRFHHFKGRNNKEQVTLTRSRPNLMLKGLIQVYNGVSCSWQGIKLTEAGKEKALMLIDG